MLINPINRNSYKSPAKITFDPGQAQGYNIHLIQGFLHYGGERRSHTSTALLNVCLYRSACVDWKGVFVFQYTSYLSESF